MKTLFAFILGLFMGGMLIDTQQLVKLFNISYEILGSLK